MTEHKKPSKADMFKAEFGLSEKQLEKLVADSPAPLRVQVAAFGERLDRIESGRKS